MEEVDRQVYLEDVRLQMDAKLWGEEFNRHNPPKKVTSTNAGVKKYNFHSLIILTSLTLPGGHYADGGIRI